MMNQEIKKARIAAFGGGSVSDTPKADSRAPMAPPLSNRGEQKPKRLHVPNRKPLRNTPRFLLIQKAV